MTAKSKKAAPLLGRPAAIPATPEEAVLDVVPNPQKGTPYLTRFTCPEFTSLCPVTGQPDFGHLVIDYVPDKLLALQKKGLVLAVAASSIAGLIIDSLVFLYLAFGSLAFLEGRVIGKAWMVILTLPVIAWLRRRDERLGLTPA